MQLLLVRHAHPNIERNDDRVADPGLSELGHWQAQRLQEWLAHEAVDAVITSPKRRAIETVHPLIEHFGVRHEIVVGLDEIDRAATTYLPTELLMTEEGADYFALIRSGDWAAIGWDAPEAFQERVWTAWSELVERRPGERVLVACHGGTIRQILMWCFGEDLGKVVSTVEYASVTRIEIGEDGTRKLASFNEVGHFDGDRIGTLGPMRDGRGASWR